MQSKFLTYVTSLLLVTTLCYCAKKKGSGSTTTPTAVTKTTDIKKIVTTGDSLSFNGLTGGVNDLALNPITLLPAVAYYDKGAAISGTTAVGALKYAYQSSNGTWTVEVIDANYGTAACVTINSYCIGAPNAAGGSTAVILKMAFNSKGNPAIAYVFGPSVGGAGTKQIRYAERDSSGNWTVSVAYAATTAVGATNVAIATYDPMKAVTLNFDSSDRPHITFAFYTQTAAGNSTLQYIYRNSGGVWVTSVAMANAVVGAGTLTAVGQGDNQGGAIMCGGLPIFTGMVVDTAAGVGKPVYNRCTALDATGACSTWVTVNMETGCLAGTSCFAAATILNTSNAGQRTDIILDPATGKPVIGVYSTGTPNTSLYTIQLANACGVAQPTAANSWGTTTLVGAASQGVNGFRLAASNSAYYLHYLNNTLGGMLSIFSAGAWFATGHITETVTVAGEGVGFAYDSTNDILYGSYAALPAAALGAFGNDLKVVTAKPADLASAGANGTLILDVVDTLVTAFPSAAVPMLAAAVSPNGTVGYVYFFQDNTVANSKIYYGVRGGASTTPIFSQRFVTNYQNGAASPQFVGSYPSLAYDSSNNPLIAYYDGVAADQQLILARSGDGGISFSQTIIDHTVANVGQFPSVATSGTSIGIAYYDVTNTGLKFARFTPGLGWKRFAVDGMAGTGSCGNAAEDDGQFAKLIFTSAGLPVIAYQSNGVNMKIAYATNTLSSTTYTWTCIAVDSSAASRGNGIDMLLDSSSTPHIVHFDATAGTIRYTRCTSAIGTCITTGPTAFTSTIVGGVGSLSTIVTRPTIQLSSTNRLYVAYYSASYQGLGLAQKALTDTTWTTEYIDSAAQGASFISQAGQYGQLLLNAAGNPMVFYRSNENWLKYFSREAF